MAQVTVVIPVCNIEKHLRQCLDSVRAQTLTDLEIICVDDGSTDTSPQILAEYAAQDNRFQIITQKNAGPGAARNAGLEYVKGEFVIFLDSDDWFEPDFLEKMTAQAKKTEADVTICRAVEFDTDSGSELLSAWMLKTRWLPSDTFGPEDIAGHIFQFTYGWPWDKLYRTEFVKKSELEYPPLPNSEDLVFVFQSLAIAKRITLVPVPLVHHRINRRSSVSNSRYRDPDVPYQALMLLQARLMERGKYHYFEQSFLNWSMEFLVWNLANMGEPEAQRRYFYKLKREWMPIMGFKLHSRKYYEDRRTYCKYLLVRYVPWPVFYGIVRGYHSLKGSKKGVKDNKKAMCV